MLANAKQEHHCQQEMLLLASHVLLLGLVHEVSAQYTQHT